MFEVNMGLQTDKKWEEMETERWEKENVKRKKKRSK